KLSIMIEEVRIINYKTKLITRTGLLLALTIGLQLLSRSLGSAVLFTGSLVNMMLIIAVDILGWQGGVSLGVFTPIVAFLLGIMKVPLIVPFIIVGNSVLVLAYYFLEDYNSYVALVVGAVVKFLVLALAVEYVLQVPPPVVKLMQLPQLYHALLGGVLAILFIKVLKRTDI
ncbi:MAG: hypothetical protein ACQEP9_00950, partial [Bacillota bacterium]